MSGVEVKVGARERVKVTIAKDSMSASVLLRKPAEEDGAITIDEVMTAVNDATIVFGLDDKALAEAVKKEHYNVPIRIAVGLKPKRGASATFAYHFDTSDKHVPKEDEDGRIDYRDINFIQNTEAGAVLVTKTPPQNGVPGKNVFGKEIEGPAGRDIPFKNGASTTVSDDGLELRATAGGAIVFQNGKVSVMNVLTINGDVDFKVGNLDCRGSVRVTGDVKVGFELTIDGDLEVSGNVEDASVFVKGNILVKGGFFGNDAGIMQADGNITMKYAEGQKIISGGDVTIGGEIINCQVIAQNRVMVKGRRGKIVGGDVKAGKEIRTSVAGSEAGTPTRLYVAYNNDLMSDYYKTTSEIKRLTEDGKRIAEALYGLYRLQIDGKLSPDKKPAFTKLQAFKKDLPENLATLKKHREEVEAKIAQLQDAQIIIEEKLYSGVKAYFGIIYREIVKDTGRCKLVLEGSQVMQSEYRGD